MVEYSIPWQFSVSHDKLSLTAGGRPMDFIYQSDSKVYLLEDFTWPRGHSRMVVRAGTRISVVGSPISRRTGANTANTNDRKKWFYVVKYLVQEGVRVRWESYPYNVAPQCLDTTLVDEPQQ